MSARVAFGRRAGRVRGVFGGAHLQAPHDVGADTRHARAEEAQLALRVLAGEGAEEELETGERRSLRDQRHNHFVGLLEQQQVHVAKGGVEVRHDVVEA